MSLLTGEDERVVKSTSRVIFVQTDHGFMLSGGDGLVGSTEQGFEPQWTISSDDITGR